MVQPNVISENFYEFGGLDYRSNSITRKSRHAAESRNAMYLKNNSVSSRPGTKGSASTKGGGGTKTFNWRDSNNFTQSQLVTIDSNLHRKLSGTVTITYTGIREDSLLSLIPYLSGTDYTFIAKITEGDTTISQTDLKTGIYEASPPTVASLVTAIDALADYTCTATGDTSGPAAFLPTSLLSLPPSVPIVISFDYWEQIYCPVSNPFQTFYDQMTSVNGELACLFNHANRLFIATGFGPLYKYDTQSVYRAGMPFTESVAASVGSATGLTGDYEYFVTYEFIDALGNVVEGDESNHSTVTLANQKGSIVIPNIQPTTGFMTSCAIINGAQAGVTTITVDSGHTLKVGQTAFFIDSSGAEQSKAITATTATTITFVGAVTVADNAVISANLKINLWRNINGSTELFYLVDTIPNNSFAATTTYIDNVADVNLEIEFSPPIEGHGEPPEDMRYLTAFDQCLVMSDGSDAVWYSDSDGSEYFNSFFLIKSKSNSVVTGLGSNTDALYVFKENEGHALTGSLQTSQFRVKSFSDSIGCCSHQSIIDVDGYVWFFSKRYGPRRLISTTTPDDVSYRILPVITNKRSDLSETISFKRVIGYNLQADQVALFYCPSETELSNEYYPNNSSFTLAADYRSQSDSDADYDSEGRVQQQMPKVRWFKWDNLNLGAGGDTLGDTFYYTERRFSDPLTDFIYPLCSFLNKGDEYDTHDHGQPMPFYYEASWEDLGKNDLLKKFNALAIYSFPELIATAFSVLASTEVDYRQGEVHSKKTLDFGAGSLSSGYDTSGWGDNSWGDPLTPKILFPLRMGKFTAMKLIFSKELYLEKPVISGWGLEANPAMTPKIQK